MAPGAPPSAGGPGKPGNTGLVWALAGGGALVIALIVVVVLVASGAFKSDDETDPPPPTATSAGPSPSSDPNARSPVVGTISDSQAGVSYPQLGGEWKLQPVAPDSGFARNYGFSRGQVAVVQANYRGNDPYLASAYSGRLPRTATYNGTADLQTASSTFARTIESEPEPNGSYPSHSRQDLESRSHSVSGKSAWYTKFRLSFPQAQSLGWHFRSETVVFIIIDQGSGQRPSVLWLTVPDNHRNGGDLDLLADSVKVP